MADPKPPKLPHPSTTPRKGKTGHQDRGRPIFTQGGGEAFNQWEVDVTPLLGATQTGRDVEGGRQKPRATFEVRCAFYGRGSLAFGGQFARRVPHTHTEDEELALAIGRALAEALRSGNRDIDIVEFARDVERRRA